jgi:hypothetical protein
VAFVSLVADYVGFNLFMDKDLERGLADFGEFLLRDKVAPEKYAPC